MALDGIFLYLLRQELCEALVGARVEKIYQPTREEVVLSFRGMKGNHKLLLSAKSSGARLHLTGLAVENPKQPPMLCMLMRKTIGSGRLTDITQSGFERVLHLCFETTDELGDPTNVTLVAELTGRNANLILLDGANKIIDAVKRVGPDKSSVRTVLPGLSYQSPPPQDKLPITAGWERITSAILDTERDIILAKRIGEVLEGASPLLCRELCDAALQGSDALLSALDDGDRARLGQVLCKLQEDVEQCNTSPILLQTQEGELKEFYCFDIAQYGSLYQKVPQQNLSELLDAFYGRRDARDRMRQRMSDFERTITARIERVERKLSAQRQELLECRDRDFLRVAGDLISSSLHLLHKGMDSVTLENYYEEGMPPLSIKLDPKLTPVANAQKYYRDYRRAATAEKMLGELIASAEEELSYLDSVYDLMQRATSEQELAAIREELSQSGYLRHTGGKKQKSAPLSPLQYRSSDGFVILSGRNNLQNDRLTLKDSRKEDIWLHTQRIPGSHTVIITGGREVPDSTLTEAAVIAATNSKARGSKKVPVDYTLIKNVRKQPGAKPGMVIYDSFKTAFVDPDEAVASSLKV